MFYRGDHFSEVHVHRPIFFIWVSHSGTLSSYLYVFVRTIVDFVLKIYMCLKINVSYRICPALSLSVFLFSYSFSRWWPLGPTQTSEIAKTEIDERKQLDLAQKKEERKKTSDMTQSWLMSWYHTVKVSIIWLMYIYHKQCEIIQNNQRNSSNGQLLYQHFNKIANLDSSWRS